MRFDEITWTVLSGGGEHGGVAGENDIGVVTLNRPDKLNAITPNMRTELDALLNEIRHKNNIRVVILTGAGRAFSTGGDLESEIAVLNQNEDPKIVDGAYRKMVEFDINDHRHVMLQRIARKFEDLPQPTIAVINGFAVGAGLEIATCCDIRVASEKARMGEIAVSAGFVTESGGARNLPKLIGKGRALEMILRGNLVSAEDALQMGLVDHVFPRDRLMESALEIARDIALKPWLATRKAKELVHFYWTHERSEEGWRRELDAVLEVTRTEDCVEGMLAFQEKRAPAYRGPFGD